MANEIERKYLLKNDAWKTLGVGSLYRQGYLSLDQDRTVRVRITEDAGYITIKGRTSGISRAEFEYEIPLEDAVVILDTMCIGPIIEKYRFKITHEGMLWEVDQFIGSNEGLVVAEIELISEDQTFDIPPWVGDEVSDDPKYYNSNLIKNPFCDWN